MFACRQPITLNRCTGVAEHAVYDRAMSETRPRLLGLRPIRLELGLTQEAFGELVGMTDVSIRRMENEQQGFTASALERIAVHSQRPWWELFGYRHPPEAALAPETIAAIAILERLPPEARAEALEDLEILERRRGRGDAG